MKLEELRQYLLAARAKLAQGWTQGALARDANEAETLPDNPDAHKFCIMGAVMAVVPPHVSCMPVTTCLQSNLEWSLITFNDHSDTTKDDVLALMDRALAGLKTDSVQTS